MSESGESLSETERIPLPSAVASYTDEIFADIAEYLDETDVTETDKVTKLELRVVAGEAVEVTEVENVE